jgi:glycine dehydrogenase
MTAQEFPAQEFAARHIGPDAEAQRRMLETVGYGAVEELMDAAIPEVIRWTGQLDLPTAATEAQAISELRDLAARNTVAVSMIGLGYSGTVTPAVIRRNVLESPAWYTAYTPYQQEIRPWSPT